jgi:YesN/AraC family two-component response regulator
MIKKFNSLIDNHFNEEFSVNFYADKLNITPNYLNILSQRYLKSPAGDIIKERTILEAKRLLTSTDLSIKEIAYQLGFNDNGYFSKVFKKYTGKHRAILKKVIIFTILIRNITVAVLISKRFLHIHIF